MTRSRNNRRVVISDSEPDIRSSSHLGSNTKPRIDGVSEISHDNLRDGSSRPDDVNSSDDELGPAFSMFCKDTPSATSTKREPDNRNSALRHTPNSNGGSKTVKRKANMWDIDARNIMSSSPQVSNQSNSERPGQRQLSTRGHGRPSYDMKHHPMDDILRPKFSAKRRAKGIEVSKDLSDSDAETDKPRRSSRKTNQSTTPIYSGKWHPLDQMLRDNASSTRAHSKKSNKRSKHSLSELRDGEIYSEPDADEDVGVLESEDETPQISSGVRRSARVSSSKDTPPNYDMKYHVMDSTLRPKAAAKRLKPKLNSPITGKKPSKSASFIKTHPEQLVTAARKSSTKRSVPPEPELESEGSDVPAAPAWSQLQNPYLNRTSLNWVELQDLDHCVYLLQKGAPLHGKTIPQSWNRVKKVLFDDGLITLDELRSREATEFLKSRYESVRLGLQNFFNSGPESIDKKDWTLFKSEGFDVYVMKRGKRYLKHHKDSLVEKTSSSFDGLSFSAGSVDHVTRDDEGTTLNNSSSKRPPASKADIVDLEDDGELGLITEIESNLVESIEEHPLSDAALEELLFPVEQYVMEESNRAFEFSASFLTHRDKALDQVNTVASEAGATDPATHDDLTRIMPHNTESSSLGIKVNPRIEFGTPQTPKVQNKTTKRRSRVGVPIAIHEDSPPQAKRIVRMKPASPGTDIPKENLDDLGSTSSVTLPYSSLFGGPVDPLSPVSSPTTG